MYILSFAILGALTLIAIIFVAGFWVYKQKQLKDKMQILSVELLKANKEVKAANMVRDVFLQNMSHQVRTPLHAINGFAQLLATPEYNFSDAEKAEFAAHIRSNTTVLTLLFDDMLSVVDIECGKFDVSISTCKVNEVVYETIETLKHMVNENVTMSFEPGVGDDFTIETDPHRLQQVLMNFMSNAIKHTEKGFIKIATKLSADGKTLDFSVTDSGNGVPKEMADAIFTRFKKLNDFKLGAGLGLSLCKTISDKLNSACYLDTTYPDSNSECDHGARFVFSAPVVQSNI
ncbi:MAG: HAMP domain-containing histidine kinase [Bacteroidales bacterium]|nr:HAMP domain-containing histidine kinase [Candidatus Liminaster caballi]